MDGWHRVGHCAPGTGEAIFLARLLTQFLPDEPEAWGLLALMLYAEARRPARLTGQGEFISLRSQDTTLWDWKMIEEAEAALRLASRTRRIGRYQQEAALQSSHVEGVHNGSVPWEGVVFVYVALVALTSSPVAIINRAPAVAELQGPDAGLSALEAAGEDRRISSYQPYWPLAPTCWVAPDRMTLLDTPINSRSGWKTTQLSGNTSSSAATVRR